ncbi:MAG TPA: choice-of-anchor Q domain-containing protein, partial [Humisphaera sp.]|nr:choice-of-anchor Q domain-containing protein [Humisphaera sp.]
MIEQCEPRVLLSTYTVNTISDASKAGTKLVSLRQAVASANSHPGPDTIQFSTGIFAAGALHRILLTKGEIVFTDKTGATTINGPGAAVLAVDGQKASRIFNIQAGVTVSISGVWVTNGFAPGGGFGGGIFNAGMLTLRSSTISNNAVDGSTAPYPGSQDGSGRGGGIYSTGTLNLQNSNVSSNTAAGRGIFYGGNFQLIAGGGGIYSEGSLTISSSVISHNIARGEVIEVAAGGGGIFSTGPMSITSTVIATNTAIGGPAGVSGGAGLGGGVFSDANVPVSIVSSQISGNVAQGGPDAYQYYGNGSGGGIWALDPVTISSSTVSGNVAAGGLGARGGGLYGGDLIIDQSTISDNTATTKLATLSGGQPGVAGGGGIYSPSSLTVTRSTITGNAAIGARGIDATTAPIPAGPGGKATGGGIDYGLSASVIDSTIVNNRAVGGAGGNGVRLPFLIESPGNGGNAQGGGISEADSPQHLLHLFDSTVFGNTAVGGAGGTNLPPLPSGKAGTATGGGIAANHNALLQNTIISGNTAGAAFSDILGAVLNSSAFNLVGVGGGLANGVNGNKVGITNPGLQPLGNYGGPTQTMLPAAGSPAINAGSNALIPPGILVDQRGMPRVFGTSVDIGADEYVSLNLSGAVYNDINGDGVRQPREPGLANWKVYIDLNNSNAFVAGDPFAITNTAGNYRFTYLPTSTQSLTV